MPATSISVTLKPDAKNEELEKARSAVTEQGGKITHEFTLIKGFTAEFPDGTVHSLETDDHIFVEADSEVTTQ